MLTLEEFWTNSETAYCSVCGFGSGEGLRLDKQLNGRLKSHQPNRKNPGNSGSGTLVICGSCLNAYFRDDESDSRRSESRQPDINKSRFETSPSINGAKWRRVDEKTADGMRQNLQTIYV